MMENYSLSDIAAATGDRNGWGGFGAGGDAWVLIILFALIFGGGGGWFGNGNNRDWNGQPVTEAGLCNAMNFNNLENAVGRLGDTQGQQFTALTNGICNLGYEQLRNNNALAMQSAQETNALAMQSAGETNATQAIIAQGDNAIQTQLAECCCTIQRGIDGINYNAAMNTAAINANTTAQVQRVLDVLCQDKMDAMAAQINHLQLQNALAGVVRYPNATTYGAGINPFFNSNCCCGSSNI